MYQLFKSRVLHLIVLFVIGFSVSQCGILKRNAWNPFPNAVGWVNDFEDIFDSQEEMYLDSIIADFEVKTSAEIAIVTLDTVLTTSASFEKYTLNLANEWGLGKAKKNNGVMIAMSKSMRKVWIQVGEGIEEQLTDEECQVIIDQTLIPFFKNDDYFEGLKLAIEQIKTEFDQ